MQWVFTFVSGPDSIWVRNVRAIAPEGEIVSLSQMPAEETGHHRHDLDRTAQAVACVGTGGGADAAVDRKSRRRAVAAGGRPGDSSRQRIAAQMLAGRAFPGQLALSARRFGQAATHLDREVEQERGPAEQIDAFAAVGDVVRSADLPELLKALSGASVFVGNDSGPEQQQQHLLAMAMAGHVLAGTRWGRGCGRCENLRWIRLARKCMM